MRLGMTDDEMGILILDAESQKLAGVLVDRNGTGKVMVRDRWGRESILTPQQPGRGKTIDDGQSAPNDDAANITVYATSSGKKYHRDGCRYLSKSKSALSLKDAKRRRLTPCKVCRP
jgi:hypothetical protein